MHPAARPRSVVRPGPVPLPRPRARRGRSLIDADALRVLHRAARVLLDDLPDLTDRLTAVLEEQEPAYRAALLTDPDGIWQEAHRSLRHSVTSLLDPGPARDAARRCSWKIGATRAEQGLPLDALLHAFRLGGSLVWQKLVEETSRSAPEDVRLLVHVAADVWNFVDEHCALVADAYRQVERQLTWRRENRVRVLAGALLDGASRIADLPETAAALGMPVDGRYVVVAVAGGRPAGCAAAREALVPPGARAHWHTGVDVDHGIVLIEDDAIGTAIGTAEAATVGTGTGDGTGGAGGASRAGSAPAVRGVRGVRDAGPVARGSAGRPGPRERTPGPAGAAGVRIGVGSAVNGLAAVGDARRFADLALSVCPAAGGTVRLEDEVPAALVVSSPDLGRTLAARVLGPLLRLDPADRDVLLDTLATWLDCDGSAQRAGERLYCHRNTVLNRLRRCEQLTGRTLTRPGDLVEISLALTARRLLPA
ncbi:helix-turn-helix domain-containing protein [Streptomyces griseoviridis]|uniref:PucR family transcriptional regulator n=1 Tax=Streptomyces griseoviridis TaxID=45398 RepID=UPI00344B42C5